MIDRYTSPAMQALFSDTAKFEIWCKVELRAVEAQYELGHLGITKDELTWIQDHIAFDIDEILAIEELTHHDVIAFLTNVGQHIDKDYDPAQPKPSRWIHYGMTSSDLVDTSFCMQLSRACDLIIGAVKKLGLICQKRAYEEKDTLCIGRTHGIHAEPMTFGMKFASWAWELHRAFMRLRAAKDEISTGAISGAVGTYSSIDPQVEEMVCSSSHCMPDPVSTQVISRDRHAFVASVLACTAATCERIAVEIRNLQRTDTLEVEEPFRKGQKGSSAMPHKRNPITAEKICGLARIVKANAQVAYDNVALWHERDISHSSTERIALIDSFIALDHMLSCLYRIVQGLVLYPERMKMNLEATRGLMYSSKILLALVDTGMSREDAYALVQAKAMQVWDDIQYVRPGLHLVDLLAQDPQCVLSKECLQEICNPQSFLINSNVIFERLQDLNFSV